MQLLFKDYNFNSLEYFTPDFKKNIEEKSVAKVKNVKKLNFLVKFLEEKYPKEVEKVINQNFNQRQFHQRYLQEQFIKPVLFNA